MKIQQEGISLIYQYFELSADDSNIKKNYFQEWFINHLIERVDYLLHNDMNSLLGILYKIDVSESAVKRLFIYSKDQLAIELTTLIIDRINQKVAYRKSNK
ncbi:MAG: hypothetical protein RIA69_14495 [Cyclobacteriaceae bacterium]